MFLRRIGLPCSWHGKWDTPAAGTWLWGLCDHLFSTVRSAGGLHTKFRHRVLVLVSTFIVGILVITGWGVWDFAEYAGCFGEDPEAVLNNLVSISVKIIIKVLYVVIERSKLAV